MLWCPDGVPIIILELELRQLEMYLLVVFNDNSVEYMHYKDLRAQNPLLYYRYFRKLAILKYFLMN